MTENYFQSNCRDGSQNGFRKEGGDSDQKLAEKLKELDKLKEEIESELRNKRLNNSNDKLQQQIGDGSFKDDLLNNNVGSEVNSVGQLQEHCQRRGISMPR